MEPLGVAVGGLIVQMLFTQAGLMIYSKKPKMPQILTKR